MPEEKFQVPADMMVDEESMSREEALAKVAMALTKSDNPQLMSDLDEVEVSMLTALETVGTTTGLEILNIFAKNFENLRVSKDRQGRKELLDIAVEIKRTPERMGRFNNLFRGLK